MGVLKDLWGLFFKPRKQVEEKISSEVGEEVKKRNIYQFPAIGIADIGKEVKRLNELLARMKSSDLVNLSTRVGNTAIWVMSEKPLKNKATMQAEIKEIDTLKAKLVEDLEWFEETQRQAESFEDELELVRNDFIHLLDEGLRNLRKIQSEEFKELHRHRMQELFEELDAKRAKAVEIAEAA